MQKNELKIWFDDLKNDSENNTIIILNESINIPNLNEKIFVLSSHGYNLKLGSIIIVRKKTYLKYNDSKSFFESIFKNLIIIIKDKESIENFLNLLKNYDEQNEVNIKYHPVEKKDFFELLKMNKEDLVNFLEKTHSSINSFYSNLQMYDDDFINTSINNLKKQNILSSSFANYLYKFAYLDFTSNTTRVGREIRKILGIKSKTINNIRTIDITFPKGKPFKGYDLNTDKYLEIKKKIAQKLINLNDKKLNVDKIAEITELPIKEVQKLFNR